jgi:hypothetical protein
MKSILFALFLLGFLFDHDNGGSVFLRNINNLLPDCTVIYHRRQKEKKRKKNKVNFRIRDHITWTYIRVPLRKKVIGYY